MKLLDPRSWKPQNRIALEATWRIGLPVGLLAIAVKVILFLIFKRPS